MSRFRRVITIAALAIPLPVAALPLAAILVYASPTTEPGETILVTETRPAPAGAWDSGIRSTINFATPPDEEVAATVGLHGIECGLDSGQSPQS